MHTNCTAAHMARISAVQLGEIGDKWVHAGTCENVDTRRFLFFFAVWWCVPVTQQILPGSQDHTGEQSVRFLHRCKYQIPKHTPKRLPLPQIIRAYHTHCKDICGFALINPPLLEIIQTLQFTLHYPPPPPWSPLLAAHKPTISYGGTCSCLSHLLSNVNILLFEFLFCISAQ